MKKKNNINDVFSSSMDDDIALNNVITVQSKFELCTEQHVVLNKIMEHLNYCKFMYFTLFTNPHKMSKFMKDNALTSIKIVKEKEVKTLEKFKVVFCRFYGLSSRQYNSIDFIIKGLIKANKTLMDDRLHIFEEHLTKKLAKQKKIKGEVNLLMISDGFKLKKDNILEECKRKKTILFNLSKSIEKKIIDIDKLKKNIKNDKVSVCFGNIKILKRLSALFNNSNYDNGKYKNNSPEAKKSYHTSYRKIWNDSRLNQFFLLGSKDEASGNSSCVFSKRTEGLYTVRISIPKRVIEELSLSYKFLIIDNITFKHNEKEILNCVALNDERKQKEQEYVKKLKNNDPSLLGDDKKIIKEAAYLENYGVAISFRFIKDTFSDPMKETTSWRILASMDESKQDKSIVSKSNGVIGIDINVDHLAVSDINRNKVLKKSFNVKFEFSDSEISQNKTVRKESILKSVKHIISYAKKSKKPIVIELLDFKRKKSLLKEENTLFSSNAAKRKNRILSSFAYSMIIEAIKQQAYRNGIAVYEVNPVYTSQIGYLKYAKKYGISRHMAAAYVIARRTYAIEELFDRDEQIIVKNQIRTIPLLVDRACCETYFEYCNKNLRNFLKRQVNQNRGKIKQSTQVSSLSVISILPLNS